MTTENHNKLYEFFFDLANILNYKDTIAGLEKYYEECIELFDKKEYIDINWQDKEGNTFLHYAMKYQKWKWCLKLLHAGADPYILNHKERNAFQMAPAMDGIVYFWRTKEMDDLKRFETVSWRENTQGFSQGFKKALFKENLSKNKFTFNSVQTASLFLKENDLYNEDNEITLITNSMGMRLGDKLSWYNNTYGSLNDKAKNSAFLSALIDNHQLHLKQSNNDLEEFFKLDFEENKYFHYAIKTILQESARDRVHENIVRSALESVKRQGFDFNWKRNESDKSLMDCINSCKTNHKIYLSIDLVVNQTKRKANKI